MAIFKQILGDKIVYEVYVHGEVHGGKRFQRRKRNVATLKQAEKIEFEMKRELAKQKEHFTDYLWPEWFDVCMHNMRHEFKPSTIYNYQTQMRKWIHPIWKNTELKSITKSMIYEVIYEKCAGIKTENNRRTVLNMLKRIFKLAFEDGVISRNPTEGIMIKVPEPIQKVLTNKEVEIFLKQAQISNHKFYPIWLMALMTGMRSGELYALRWTDIDFETRMISVSRTWNSKNGYGSTKTGRSRVVPMSESLVSFLMAYRMKRPAGEEHVLPHYREWQGGEQARVTQSFCRMVGVTEVKFHDLRATFITNLLARGETLARVMSVVGHTQLKTTNIYLRKAGVDVQGGTDKLGYEVPQEQNARILPLRGV